MSRATKLLVILVVLLQVLFFIFAARHRFVDGDEGFYVMASRLVLEHKRPYLDFFYEQAPLLPYIYSNWMRWFGTSWTSVRLLSALLSGVLGTLLCQHVCRQTKSWLAGITAVLLFASSALVFAWFPVVKTFSLAGVSLFAAYAIVSTASKMSALLPLAVSGALLALAVDTRSYLVVLIPLFIWWIRHNFDFRGRRSSILWFLGGLSLGILPCVYFFISSPNAFLFNNLGMHGIRSAGGLVGSWREKTIILLGLFLKGGSGIQNSVLVLISLALTSLVPKRDYPPRFALQIAGVIAIVSILPTPTLSQYFCFCVPFLIVSTVCALDDLFSNLTSRRDRLVVASGCLALLVAYVGAAAGQFREYLFTGDPGGRSMQHVLGVSRAVDEIAAPGEIAASFWPGYIFQSKVNPLPGFEFDYGLHLADKITSQQRNRYHMLSLSELEAKFASHVPRIVVLGQKNFNFSAEMRDDAKRSLRQNGYIPVRSIGDTSIYLCCSR